MTTQGATTTRRHFFFGTLLAGAVPAGGYGSVSSLYHLGYKSPNEKLNVAAIGAGGRGYTDIHGCRSENIVAFADPDDKRAARTYREFPTVPKYKDFRRMLDKESRKIDAVIIATPDHMHATAAMWAMERGKHVYCEKPLTRTFWEARQLAAAARKYNVATQMGNQGYSLNGTRQCCEIIWNGDIGDVSEVHGWTNRPIWPQGPGVVPKEAPVPETLDWDVWLGIAAMRPYSPAYIPADWKGFPDFGCGAIGDMACHILGPANMAMRLGAPTSVECVVREGKSQYTFPQRSVIRFDFPARGAMPPVKIFWHDSMTKPPEIPGVDAGEVLDPKGLNGSVFIGSKGMLTTGTYGHGTRLLPASRMQDYRMPPQFLTRAPGEDHYRDWLRACKGGEPASSNFSVSGPFVQWMLLGIVSMRFEGRLEWDGRKMQFTNNKEANKYLQPRFRKGWKFT